LCDRELLAATLSLTPEGGKLDALEIFISDSGCGALETFPTRAAARDLSLSMNGKGCEIICEELYVPALPKDECFAARSAKAGSDENCSKQ
jgi:hypothetical protein